jgi:hypothetical protein
VDDLKKRLPWYAAIGIVGAAIAALSALGWAPWESMDKSEAREIHREMRVEAKESLVKYEESSNKVHEAILDRLAEDRENQKIERQEVKQVLDKLDRRTWQMQRDLRSR